jgi:hypothetical protein
MAYANPKKTEIANINQSNWRVENRHLFVCQMEIHWTMRMPHTVAQSIRKSINDMSTDLVSIGEAGTFSSTFQSNFILSFLVEAVTFPNTFCTKPLTV